MYRMYQMYQLVRIQCVLSSRTRMKAENKNQMGKPAMTPLGVLINTKANLSVISAGFNKLKMYI